MKQFLGAVVGSLLVLGLSSSAHADDKDAMAVLDKAIKALGGEEKLNKVKAVSWKAKGKHSISGNESDITIQSTVQGLDHLRREYESERGGKKQFRNVTVLAGDNGWVQLEGIMGREMNKNSIAKEKRALYLEILPITLVQLKEKDYKLDVAGEEKVGDNPAVGIKVTAPDGKDFTLFFDKESGLPVKLVAAGRSPEGKEAMNETTFSNYKEFGGIKKATKIEKKSNGVKSQEMEITEFKFLDKVDPKTFDEPK